MNVTYNLDNDDCIYKTKHILTVVKNNISQKDEYYFSIYSNDITNDSIKLTIINATNDVESYTSIINRTDYEDLKRSQNLIINFDEFCKQIKMLLCQYEEKKIKMRLIINDLVQLGFYTMSDLKELTVLIIPFYYTCTEEVISYLRKKITNLEISNKICLDQNSELQNKISELNQKNNEISTNLSHMYEENQIIEEKLEEMENKCEMYINLLEEANRQKETLLSDLKESQKSNSELNKSVNVLKSDVDSLKIGVEYYLNKTKHLHSVLINKEKTTVPADKYEKLNAMFCSAVADLLKCQVNFKKILSLHELQKSKNCTLKEELTNCIDIIKNLEKKVEEDQIKSAENNNSGEKMDQLNEILKKLETQNTK